MGFTGRKREFTTSDVSLNIGGNNNNSNKANDKNMNNMNNNSNANNDDSDSNKKSNSNMSNMVVSIQDRSYITSGSWITKSR